MGMLTSSQVPWRVRLWIVMLLAERLDLVDQTGQSSPLTRISSADSVIANDESKGGTGSLCALLDNRGSCVVGRVGALAALSILQCGLMRHD